MGTLWFPFVYKGGGAFCFASTGLRRKKLASEAELGQCPFPAPKYLRAADFRETKDADCPDADTDYLREGRTIHFHPTAEIDRGPLGD